MRGTAEPMEGVFEPMSHDATVKRHGRRMSRRLLGAVVGAAVLAGSAAATASAQQYPVTSGDPRIGLAAGPGDTAGKVSLGMQHLSNTPLPPVVNGINSDARLPGQLRVRRQLQRRQHLRRLQPGGARARDGALLHRQPERRLGPRQPAVRVGGVRQRQARLHRVDATEGVGDPRDALPRHPHLRHLRHPQPEAHPGRRCADLPRLAHAHAADAEERPEQRLHLRLGHVVVVHRRPRRSPA